MTKKQEELLDKKFKVNEHFSIRRRDYEELPCHMLAWCWNDDRMKEQEVKDNWKKIIQKAYSLKIKTDVMSINS